MNFRNWSGTYMYSIDVVNTVHACARQVVCNLCADRARDTTEREVRTVQMKLRSSIVNANKILCIVYLSEQSLGQHIVVLLLVAARKCIFFHACTY